MSTDAPRKFDSKTVTICSGEMKRVAVGSYVNSEHKPTFTLTAQPDIGERLACALEKIDVPGNARYILFYHLQNFSDRPCQVTVVRGLA